MRPQEAKPGLDPREIYWARKLQPFHQGTGALPCAVTSEETGRRHITAVVPKPATGELPLEVATLTAFLLTLHRYSGGREILIASGDVFVVSSIDEDLPLRTFIGSLQSELRESRENVPHTGASLNGSLAFVGFVWNTDAAPSIGSRLALQVEEAADSLTLKYTFDASVYPSFFVDQISASVARLLSRVVKDLDVRVADIDVLSPEERRRVVSEFNATTSSYPGEETLHSLIERQAASRPGEPAVAYENTTLTYADLNSRANQLARCLTDSFGVRAGDTVGIMARRSEKVIVSMFGVLKAGAAYVPINPRHPWEIVRYMLENAGVRLLIVDSDSAGAASAFGGQLFIVDIELDGLTNSAEPLQGRVSPDSLAYVIYTSGSTGKPKGVAVEHRAILNTILWRNDFYALTPNDVNLQMPSFSFDSSVVDIFCVLVAGGKLVIPQEDLRLDSRYLTGLIKDHGITGFIATPSYYKLLVAELREAAPHLRYVTLAGETLTKDLLEAHAQHLPRVTAFNEYGPTENAVCSTACVVDAAQPTVTIGKPIPNVQVFVLDERLRVCPPGVPGEIFLGGAGLARGYFNQQELTAAQFIEHPVAEFRPGRVYKTGDRACWRPDGTLEFLGRLDNQVKIRGFRIELDDVEGTILKHPSVSDAAVLAKKDSQGATYLAAYIAARSPLTTVELREFLSSRMQFYAVPERIVFLDKLPLNLNGKVDRNQLRQRNDVETGKGGGISDLSPIERTLLETASLVLNRSSISLDDNFFEAGGNSLRVMEFFTRVRGSFRCDVTLLDIYAYPTIRELAHRLTLWELQYRNTT